MDSAIETGNNLQVAREILRRNLLGGRFPGFWMETPLLGAPGFDFHVSYDRPDLPAGVQFNQGDGFGHQRLVDWFLNEETGGVGLGFAHDILTGPDGGCAVYANVNHRPLDSNAGFEADRIVLMREGYYSLINGYKDAFLDRQASSEAGEDRYISGTKFEHLSLLFELDRLLKERTFPMLVRAETIVRQLWRIASAAIIVRLTRTSIPTATVWLLSITTAVTMTGTRQS